MWLAARTEGLPERLKTRHETLRADLRAGGHARTADNIASLLLGLEMFAEYAELVDDPRITKARAALVALGVDQKAQERSEDPVKKFLNYLASVLSGKLAHVM
jgi:hypothetical protein